MRIAILYAGSISRISGSDERVLQIAKGLADNGAQVTLSATIKHSVEALNLSNLQVIPLPHRMLKLPSTLDWIAQLVAGGLACRYDVIQIESFSFPRSMALFLLLRPFGRKFVIVFHDKWFIQDPRKSVDGRLQLILQKILITIFDVSITPGLSVKKWFEELHGKLAHQKMMVIPNGAPDLHILEDVHNLHLREIHRIDPNAFVILYFGSMTFQPNLDAALHLLKISNSVSSEFEKNTEKKLIFIVGGIGSEALPTTECFIPLGFVEKLDELLSLPDVILFPHTPSFTGPHVKTIYAFISKKPVIATEDAIKDMPHIIPGKHFLPFDIQKPRSLLESLLEIYYNKELRENLAYNAYQYSKKYSWEKITSLHLELYKNLLQKSD